MPKLKDIEHKSNRVSDGPFLEIALLQLILK
jgi:hypothetical protein